MIEALYDDMLTVPSSEDMTTSIGGIRPSHVMAFATEHARLSGQVVMLLTSNARSRKAS
ncbi:MAG: hypothetical protein ACLSUW_05610 [Akkermansia sp.]